MRGPDIKSGSLRVATVLDPVAACRLLGKRTFADFAERPGLEIEWRAVKRTVSDAQSQSKRQAARLSLAGYDVSASPSVTQKGPERNSCVDLLWSKGPHAKLRADSSSN